MQSYPETYNAEGLDRNGIITLVYNRYGKKLYSYAIKTWLLNEDEAWDMIYKTIYKTVDSYTKYKFETEEKFASFIFKIFINYLRNHYRDTKAKKEIGLTQVDHENLSTEKLTEEPQISDNKKLIALNEVLDNMQDWERMLLLMRSEGRPYSEIAQFIDKPEGQLKVYYQRLKAEITKKINERI